MSKMSIPFLTQIPKSLQSFFAISCPPNYSDAHMLKNILDRLWERWPKPDENCTKLCCCQLQILQLVVLMPSSNTTPLRPNTNHTQRSNGPAQDVDRLLCFVHTSNNTNPCVPEKHAQALPLTVAKPFAILAPVTERSLWHILSLSLPYRRTKLDHPSVVWAFLSQLESLTGEGWTWLRIDEELNLCGTRSEDFFGKH
jgi:hypothetical protein